MRLREQILRQKAAVAFEKSRETGWGERASAAFPGVQNSGLPGIQPGTGFVPYPPVSLI